MLFFFRILNQVLDQKEKKAFNFYIILSIFVPIVEIMSIGAMIAVIAFFFSDGDTLPSTLLYFKELIDLENNNQKFIIVLLCINILIFILKNLYLFFYKIFETKTKNKILANKSYNLFKGYISVKYLYMKSLKKSEIFNNTIIEPQRVVQYIFSIVMLVRDFLIVFFLLTATFIVEPKYTLILFLSLSLFTILIIFKFNKKNLIVGNKLRKINEEYISLINNSHNLFKILFFNNKQFFFLDRFNQLLKQRADNHTYQEVFRGSPKFFVEVFVVIILSLLLISEVLQNFKDIDSFLIFMSLLAFISLRLIPIFTNLNTYIASLKFSEASINNYKNIIEKNNSNFLAKSEKISNNHEILKNDSLILKVQNLGFSFEENKLFDNLNFNIEKNKIFGIFGKSGSGKSTLVDLISGLIKPHNGSIKINGEIDIYDILKFWQLNIGYVPQEPILFNDSIQKNICLETDMNKIDFERLNYSIELTGVQEILSKNNINLQSVIGEGGGKLSGGQKQRIGIARAIYFNPLIYIFDEPTASLDSLSEKKIISLLHKLKDKKMIILISHSLEIKSSVDNFINLDEMKY